MKISRDNIRELITKLEELEQVEGALKDHAAEWLEKAEEWYEESYKHDAEWRRYEIQIARNGLEEEMDSFIQTLAFVYDFMHEGRWAEIEHGRFHVTEESSETTQA